MVFIVQVPETDFSTDNNVQNGGNLRQDRSIQKGIDNKW